MTEQTYRQDEGTVEEQVVAEIIAMVLVILEDYGLDDTEISSGSRFTDDLELESIDLVTLAGELQERWGVQVNFADFIAGMELDEIIGLTVGQLAGYVVSCLQPTGMA